MNYEFELPYEPVVGGTLDETKLAELPDVLQTAVVNFRDATYQLLKKNAQGLKGPAILTKLRNEYNLDAMKLWLALGIPTIDRLMNQPVMRAHFRLSTARLGGEPTAVWTAVLTEENHATSSVDNAEIIDHSSAFSGRGGGEGVFPTETSGSTSAILPVAGDNDDWDEDDWDALPPSTLVVLGRRATGTVAQPALDGGLGIAANAQGDNDDFPAVVGGFALRGAHSGSTATIVGATLELPSTTTVHDVQQDNTFELPDHSRYVEPDHSYVPPIRQIDDLFDEDQAVTEDYKTCADEDDEIAVIGRGGNDVRKISTWAEAHFVPALTENISRAQFVKPRPIQQYAVPVVMDGHDMKGHADTGSGKSAAFLLPIINWIIENKQAGKIQSRAGAPFALVLEPTRELALQIYDQARKFSHLTGVSVAKAYGKYQVGANARELNCGCDVLVATIGRAKHFAVTKRIIFDNLQFFVLDEADRLLDDEFGKDVCDIVATSGFPTTDKRQTLLFSATFPHQVQLYSEKFLRPDNVMISRKDRKMGAASARVIQRILAVPRAEKKRQLLALLENELEEVRTRTPAGEEALIRRTLIFVRNSSDADSIASFLADHQLNAWPISGGVPQAERELSLLDFRQNRVRIIVATDVLARGLDIHGLDHVINMDLPCDYSTYVQRVGRTGRIHEGFATSFFDPAGSNDHKLANYLVEELKRSDAEVPRFLAAVARGETPLNATGIDDDDWGDDGAAGGEAHRFMPAAYHGTDS